LLRARGIRRRHLMVECWLSGDSVPARRGANDSHAGTEDRNGSDEYQSFLIGL
jgi:hypothetical protein